MAQIPSDLKPNRASDWPQHLTSQEPPGSAELAVATRMPMAHLVFHSLCSGSTARCPCPERTAAHPTC